MKVLFDSQIFNAQKYGGISRYYVRLAENLRLIDDVSISIFSPLFINKYLSQLACDDIFRGLEVNQRLQPISKVLSHAATHLAVSYKSPNIVHKTYYYPERYPMGNNRSVLTVYDMIHELYPENFGRFDLTSKFKYEAVKKADHIICISENTRSDLLRLWNCDPDKVSVVHLGFDGFQSSPLSPSITNFIKNSFGEFILFVGLRSGHKNFHRLLEAYGKDKSLHNQFNLVCFGGGAFKLEELTEINKLGLQSKLFQVDGEDDVLCSMYLEAKLFVYPSIYEGFGIPPLEAMSVGCPVAAAIGSSISEVCGSAVEYFDPLDVDSIADSLGRVLGDYRYKERLVASGFLQSEKFSWRKCATETLNCYKAVTGR